MTSASSRRLQLVQVDVFTDRVLGGNPLAVFLDGRGVSDGEMQAIAGEMNLSETVFVLPPETAGHTAKVRIFTPRREIPFAGHPTIGTAWVLANRGMLPSGATSLVLEEGIGPVPVSIEGDPRNPSFLWMGQRDPELGPELAPRKAFAEALGLTADDLHPRAPIQTGSSGNAFLFIPLRDREAVDRAELRLASMNELADVANSLGVFVCAPDPDPAAGRVYARMFAPRSGVPEDPATGSAGGPLGAYLVMHRLVTPAERVRVVCEQGTKMGRQSFIHIRLSAPDGRPTDIEVGGGAAPVLEGVLTLP